jgi:hypothetical protein
MEIPRLATIYKLSIGDQYYYGSTIVGLKTRVRSHQDASKRRPNQKLYKAILTGGGWEKVKTEIVETFPFTTKKEMWLRERTFVRRDDPLCLNCYDPAPTPRPKRESKRTEARQAYDKIYYEHHKEEIKQRRMEYYYNTVKTDPGLLKRHRENCRHAQKRLKDREG